MSCLGPYYDPEITREWSRVTRRCDENLFDTSSDFVSIPLLGIVVPKSEVPYYLSMLRKGNVLQYKANSGNLTKSQVYSKICTKTWLNANTSWATQTQSYTNPNIKNLYRVNNTLICGTIADPITNKLIKDPNTDPLICRPSTDSGVPGPPVNLCWNERIQSWYTKTYLNMNNSSDKWPVGSKGIFPYNGFTEPVITPVVTKKMVLPDISDKLQKISNKSMVHTNFSTYKQHNFYTFSHLKRPFYRAKK
jgi:hypothetical protein